MARGEMLPIQHAARALGAPDDQVRRLAKQGTIPGAVEREGDWLIPTMSLVAIAKQQGWTLDLAALQQQLDEHALSRYSGDALAAQAAVLLAKTQATAARVESRDLLRRLREATSAAEADRAARAEASETLADLREKLEDTRRSQAVAEARLNEVRSRLSNDDQQFRFMVDRIKTLEQERQNLNRSLGWFGRLRYRRLAQRELPQAARSVEKPTAERPAVELVGPEVTAEPDAEPVEASAPENWSAPAMAPLPPRVAMTFPPVSISSASTVVQPPDGVGQRQPDVTRAPVESPATDDDPPRPGGRLPRRYTQVPRTQDGRFDRSVLPGERATSPLPTR